MQEHFRQSKPAKTAEQLQRQRQQLLANVPEESRAQIKEQMLGMATGARRCSPSLHPSNLLEQCFADYFPPSCSRKLPNHQASPCATAASTACLL